MNSYILDKQDYDFKIINEQINTYNRSIDYLFNKFEDSLLYKKYKNVKGIESILLIKSYEDNEQPEKKKGIFLKILETIKKVIGEIGNFFKKYFDIAINWIKNIAVSFTKQYEKITININENDIRKFDIEKLKNSWKDKKIMSKEGLDEYIIRLEEFCNVISQSFDTSNVDEFVESWTNDYIHGEKRSDIAVKYETKLQNVFNDKDRYYDNNDIENLFSNTESLSKYLKYLLINVNNQLFKRVQTSILKMMITGKSKIDTYLNDINKNIETLQNNIGNSDEINEEWIDVNANIGKLKQQKTVILAVRNHLTNLFKYFKDIVSIIMPLVKDIKMNDEFKEEIN